MRPWIVACQAPLSIEFSRQEYWNRLPCPVPRDLPYPRIKPESPALEADSLPLSHQESLFMRRGKYKRKILEMHWKLRDQQLKQSCVYIYTVIEEEKLKFYITSCSFCFCNSAYSLQSLDHVGHVGSESGDLKY